MFKAFAGDIFPGDPYKGYSSSDLGLIFFDMLTIASGETASMNNQYTNTIFDLLDYYGDRLC